jgi:hypothetical protein
MLKVYCHTLLPSVPAKRMRGEVGVRARDQM